jgi:c-di-GMP-binding flagellar brake protein YcgR
LGIALDVSKGGILLETPYSIKSSILVLTAIDKQKKIIEVKGRLIYSKKASNGTYLCGIEFISNEERVKDFITKLVKEYNVQRNNLFITLKKKFYRGNSRSNHSKLLPPLSSR